MVLKSAILLTNGKVLFTGGLEGEDFHAELYDPVTGVFAPTGNMTTPRLDHSVTLLADGTVLLAGSQRTGSDGGRAFASAELYDPVTGTFSATGEMITPRFGQAARFFGWDSPDCGRLRQWQSRSRGPS